MLKFGKPTTADTWAEFDQFGRLLFFDEEAARSAVLLSPDAKIRYQARMMLSVLEVERERVAENQWPDYIEEKQ